MGENYIKKEDIDIIVDSTDITNDINSIKKKIIQVFNDNADNKDYIYKIKRYFPVNEYLTGSYDEVCNSIANKILQYKKEDDALNKLINEGCIEGIQEIDWKTTPMNNYQVTYKLNDTDEKQKIAFGLPTIKYNSFKWITK